MAEHDLNRACLILTVRLHSRQAGQCAHVLWLRATQHAVGIWIVVVLLRRATHILLALAVARGLIGTVAHGIVAFISSVRREPRDQVVSALTGRGIWRPLWWATVAAVHRATQSSSMMVRLASIGLRCACLVLVHFEEGNLNFNEYLKMNDVQTFKLSKIVIIIKKLSRINRVTIRLNI